MSLPLEKVCEFMKNKNQTLTQDEIEKIKRYHLKKRFDAQDISELMNLEIKLVQGIILELKNSKKKPLIGSKRIYEGIKEFEGELP